jgi:Transglycosylase SLT domain
MRCRNLFVMIAAVAAWAIVAGPGAEAAVSSKEKPRAVDAHIRALIRKNSKNTQIVTFANHRLAPVRIVRGAEQHPSGLVSRGSVTVVTFSGKKVKPVSILRGGSVIAAVAVIPAPEPTRRARPAKTETVSFANPRQRPVTVLRGSTAPWFDSNPLAVVTNTTFELFPAARGADLDRIAFAVDGAESSHGMDPGMWRPEFSGPQGPMQVSAAAAIDLGGGDRFDLTQNRLLGRGYLARLYRRYGDWPDAIAAYNWGRATWMRGSSAAARLQRCRSRSSAIATECSAMAASGKDPTSCCDSRAAVGGASRRQRSRQRSAIGPLCENWGSCSTRARYDVLGCLRVGQFAPVSNVTTPFS